ncbi:unnamed protein product [Blepharisma stoltei]|uniref:Uncharacterized protein n=1 Tax=Blepharisma stoltei TaxID=1481888 RepID=A0AAU9JMI2_9CILI|nr:unnamed protein product [Blepharisma stoltei]
MSRSGRDISSSSSDEYPYNIPMADLDEYSPTTSADESVEISNFDRRLEAYFDQCSVAITAGKNLNEIDRMKFLKQQKIFNEEMSKKWELLRHEQRIYENNIEKAKSQCYSEDHIIEINIGGTHSLTVSLETLMRIPDSALASFFTSEELYYHNGKIFIDRDSDPFIQMINFLRTNRVPIRQNPADEIRFKEELEYWGIPFELPSKNISSSLRYFDAEWCAPTLSLESNNTIIRKISYQHGICFGGNMLCESCPYVEVKIDINESSANGSHIFIGAVDKSKYEISQLTSTLWRDSPSSWYWDVWSNKLIKTDENGQHSVENGYGCGCCEEMETVIGILYNAKHQTLSFYKRGICQGIAFRNVPSGLYPSIDVWFGNGTVSILQTQLPSQKKLMWL